MSGGRNDAFLFFLGRPEFPIRVVGPTELESVTSCVSSRRSNQLSYGPLEKLQYIMRVEYHAR